MALDPKKIESIILDYSSLTRLAIALGFDAVRGIRAFINAQSYTPEQREEIYTRVMAEAAVSEALSRAIASSGPPPPEG